MPLERLASGSPSHRSPSRSSRRGSRLAGVQSLSFSASAWNWLLKPSCISNLSRLTARSYGSRGSRSCAAPKSAASQDRRAAGGGGTTFQVGAIMPRLTTRIALALSTALMLTAAPAAAQRIERIVAFGDSYADDGNLFELLGIPRPAIYPNGRFRMAPTSSTPCRSC